MTTPDALACGSKTAKIAHGVKAASIAYAEHRQGLRCAR